MLVRQSTYITAFLVAYAICCLLIVLPGSSRTRMVTWKLIMEAMQASLRRLGLYK